MKSVYVSPELAAKLDQITWWGWLLVLLVALLLCVVKDAVQGRDNAWSRMRRLNRQTRERDYWRERLRRWGR